MQEFKSNIGLQKKLSSKGHFKHGRSKLNYQYMGL